VILYNHILGVVFDINHKKYDMVSEVKFIVLYVNVWLSDGCKVMVIFTDIVGRYLDRLRCPRCCLDIARIFLRWYKRWTL